MFTMKETKEGYSVFLEKDILLNGRPKIDAKPVVSFDWLDFRNKADEWAWKAYEILEERYGHWT